MKRYFILTAAILMNCCLGGIYAWSVFVPALQKTFHYSMFQTQIVFGTTLCVFTTTMIFTGRLQDRLGPRPLAMAAGVLLAVSYRLAAAGAANFYLLWLAVGVVGGLGIACGYVCPIATGVKWFPRHKGLVCGLAVAGYGAGALLLSTIATALFRAGWDVQAVFKLVGVIYGATVVAAGAVLSAPPRAEHEPHPAHLRLRPLLSDRRFWALGVGMFCGTFPGLMTIGNLKPIGLWLGLGDVVAASAIGALSIGNAAGRITWGFIGDRLGGRRSILVSTAAIVAVTTLPLAAGGNPWAFPLVAAVVGFFYGSAFSLYPAEVAEFYGPSVLGSVYSLVIVWHGLACPFAAGLGGAIFDHTRSYTPALLLGAALAAVGWIMFAILAPRSRPKHRTPAPTLPAKAG